MSIFRKKTDKEKELLKLLQEKNKREKALNKKLEKRMEMKYTSKYLKENKKFLTSNAMTIDTLEYAKMVSELKKRFPDM
ncbi:MAG: hypothetical protein ACI4JF_09740 [Oscillospiraceae bacterium]